MVAMHRYSRMALAAALLAAGTPALADVKDGVDAWSRGDYAKAVTTWQKDAARGDVDAQYNLAQAYRLGRGVAPDMAKAEALYAQAAAGGIRWPPTTTACCCSSRAAGRTPSPTCAMRWGGAIRAPNTFWASPISTATWWRRTGCAPMPC